MTHQFLHDVSSKKIQEVLSVQDRVFHYTDNIYIKTVHLWCGCPVEVIHMSREESTLSITSSYGLSSVIKV